MDWGCRWNLQEAKQLHYLAVAVKADQEYSGLGHCSLLLIGEAEQVPDKQAVVAETALAQRLLKAGKDRGLRDLVAGLAVEVEAAIAAAGFQDLVPEANLVVVLVYSAVGKGQRELTQDRIRLTVAELVVSMLVFSIKWSVHVAELDHQLVLQSQRLD